MPTALPGHANRGTLSRHAAGFGCTARRRQRRTMFQIKYPIANSSGDHGASAMPASASPSPNSLSPAHDD
jgi:hypothetical protein